jgi:hypothetical protein
MTETDIRPLCRGPGTSACGQFSRTTRQHDHHDELIPLTAAEIRRMLTIFNQPQHPGEHYQRWSRWRRRYQARARKHHYQRRQQLHFSLRL